MNVLFLSLGKYSSITEREIYTDLLRKFTKEGNCVYVLSPIERRDGGKTCVIEEKSSLIIKVKTGNIQKTNIIEKGISTLLIEYQFLNAIKKNLSDIKFDLVLYPTPPITFVKCVEYIKKRDGAKAYLMLKDIFPQNAVDIGMMTKTGPKGLLYKYFRKKEKRLYALSDYIGCMSRANVDYILKNNPEINSQIVEVCPNAVETQDFRLDGEEKSAMRTKYGIPNDKIVFVYGGNLGKPQNIPFIIECLNMLKNHREAFFLIVGGGTEYDKLEAFVADEKPSNVKLMRQLPKDDYDRMVASCDVGLIFLDHRFTIPNFPSRLLSYMQAGLPVLACTDGNTDIGQVITSGDFGWWCESDCAKNFADTVCKVLSSNIDEKKKNSFSCLKDYDVDVAYRIIMNHIEGKS